MNLHSNSGSAGIVGLTIVCAAMLATQTLLLDTSEAQQLSADERDQLNRAAMTVIQSSSISMATFRRVTHISLPVDAIPNSSSINIQFFDDGPPLVLTRDSVATTTEGAVYWVGHVGANATNNRVLLVIKNGNIVGSIQSNKIVYQIRPLRNPQRNIHTIYEIDQTKFLPEHDGGPPRLPPRRSSGPATLSPVIASASIVHPFAGITLASGSAATTVDLLVVYGQDVISQAGTTIDMEIDHAVLQANQAFTDSGINLFLCLVDRVPRADYTGTGVLSQDLDCLLLIDDPSICGVSAAVPAIRSRRDTSNVDLVSVWVEQGGQCGFAYDNDGTAMDPELAYSVIARSGPTCTTTNYSVAHELGHTMGLRHDRFDSNVRNLNNGKLNYGHFNNSSAVQERTIMGTQGSSNGSEQTPSCPGSISNCWCEFCSRNGRWSNPSLNYSGDGAMGIAIATDPSNAANNAAALEGNKSTVAAFRTASGMVNACKNAIQSTDTTPPAAPQNLTIR